MCFFRACRNPRCFFLWVCCCMFVDLTKKNSPFPLFFLGFVIISEKYIWRWIEVQLTEESEHRRSNCTKVVLYDCFVCSPSICQPLLYFFYSMYFLLTSFLFLFCVSLTNYLDLDKSPFYCEYMCLDVVFLEELSMSWVKKHDEKMVERISFLLLIIVLLY